MNISILLLLLYIFFSLVPTDPGGRLQLRISNDRQCPFYPTSVPGILRLYFAS